MYLVSLCSQKARSEVAGRKYLLNDNLQKPVKCTEYY